MGKMFTYEGNRLITWNPQTGCLFDCYNHMCWAKRLITTRLKDSPKYKDCGFKPTFHQDKEITKQFHEGEFIFISSMGDISFASQGARMQIFTRIYNNQKTTFLFCTKNPAIYKDYPHFNNVYYGATIETNRDTSKFSKAPLPEDRYKALMELPQNYKRFLSIEPIMDFDMYEFTKMVVDITPKIVEIGADSQRNNLPEPSGEKVKVFMESLKANGIEVVEKEGLQRIINA
jgi:DNA repair photolyase